MDLSTLVLVAVLLTFASAAILLVVLRTRKTYPGFGLWTVGMLLVLSGTLVYLISRMIEPWIGILIGSFLLVAGFVFLYRGLLVFRGRSASYALEVLLTLLFFAGFMFWGFVSPNINMRIAIYSLCIGSVTLASLRLVITDRPPYFGSSDYVLAFWLGIITVFTWSRAVYAVVFLDPINDALGGGNFQSVYVAFQIISVLIITLSLINLNSQRLEYELRGVQRSLEEDIEERRRIEGALLRSQQQYRSLTENMDDNAWIFDMDEQRFVYISSSVRDLSGYSAEEAMSMGMARMVLPADRDRMQAVLAERYEDFLSMSSSSPARAGRPSGQRSAATSCAAPRPGMSNCTASRAISPGAARSTRHCAQARRSSASRLTAPTPACSCPISTGASSRRIRRPDRSSAIRPRS